MTLSDTGSLPPEGGSLSAALATLQAPGLVSVSALTAATSGAGSLAKSAASVTHLSVLPGTAAALTASLVQAQTQAACDDSGQAAATGSTQIVNLTLGDHPILVTGAPNQTVALLGGAITLIINEQVAGVPDGSTAITVNALHLKVAGRADVIVASASSGITCAPIVLT